MKKTAFITGAFSTSLICMGSFLKMLHVPGSDNILAISVLLISFVFIPTMFRYLYTVSK